MKRNGPDFLGGNVAGLLGKFALASAVSGLVGAVYNIVDQIFIGNCVGLIGNAATNVVFPLVTLSNAIAIMAGVGASAGFSLELGRGEQGKAGHRVGAGLLWMLGSGFFLTILTLGLTEPMMRFFGATEENLPYAVAYQHITACSLLFFIFSVGGSAIIRADGSPQYALFSVCLGAVVNIGLDALFMVHFRWSIRGAAWATFAGQSLSGLTTLYYFLFRFRSFPLKWAYLRPDAAGLRKVFILGLGPFVNHASQMLVQILLNNALAFWGAVSIYGSDIPLACAGITAKVSSITTAIVIGIAQGAQPIISFNYGAKRCDRARETGKLAIYAVLAFSFAVFFCFQLFPRQITLLFGADNSEAYYAFAVKWFRIHMMLICVSGLQITVGNFFTALGKPMMSVLISVSRQVIAFPLLLLFLPRLFGLNGVLVSGPLADGLCAATAMAFFLSEWRKLKLLEQAGKEA